MGRLGIGGCSRPRRAPPEPSTKEPLMSPFTLDELERMRTTLWRRYAGPLDPNVVEIAFSVALKDGQIDPTRGLAATFYVTQKKKRVPGGAVPKVLTVRLKRGSRFEAVQLRTDVV